MISAYYSTFGDPSEVIELKEIPSETQLSETEVKIQMEVSSINPADLLVIQGLYPLRPKLPAVPGNEGVGKVVELGSKVTHLSKGDRVFIPFRSGIGAWREELTFSAQNVFPIKGEADPEQLAMAAVNPPSAYYMLTKFTKLHPGDYIIQNAANSAVGRYVIAFAKNMGVKTVNVVRRPDIVEDLYKAGGDHVVVDSTNLRKDVKKLVGDAQIRLALDGVAGEATHRLSQCLAFNSIVVNYGAMSLKKCELGATQTIFNQTKLMGMWLQKWTEIAPANEVKELYDITNEAVIKNSVRTRVEKVYPLAEIKQALLHASKNKRDGKILISGPAYSR